MLPKGHQTDTMAQIWEISYDCITRIVIRVDLQYREKAFQDIMFIRLTQELCITILSTNLLFLFVVISVLQTICIEI